VIDRSLKNIAFTVDPLAGTYEKLLQDGVDAGTTTQADITGIFDLSALNSVLGEGTSGTKISAQGLGKD
jgi:NitT/TauT family transport system substrate-binding protein